MEINQTANPFTIFGTPSRVTVDGKKISREKAALVTAAFNCYRGAVKAFRLSCIGGAVRLDIVTYTKADRAKLFANQYGVKIERFCTRCACMDCTYFNYVYLSEINRDCPLLQKKEKAIEIGYAELVLKSIREGTGK